MATKCCNANVWQLVIASKWVVVHILNDVWEGGGLGGVVVVVAFPRQPCKFGTLPLSYNEPRQPPSTFIFIFLHKESDDNLQPPQIVCTILLASSVTVSAQCVARVCTLNANEATNPQLH